MIRPMLTLIVQPPVKLSRTAVALIPLERAESVVLLVQGINYNKKAFLWRRAEIWWSKKN